MTILRSIDPANLDIVWEGAATDPAACAVAVDRSRTAGRSWAATPLETRVAIARRFAEVVRERTAALAETIARETGKLLPEALAEVASTVAKVEVSIAAQHERAGTRSREMAFGSAVLRHRPHGVMVVLGPYNFPAHLPNGHIVPALLAGNSVLFKPSEETPLTGLALGEAWRAAGLPDDVLQVLPGGRETGAAILAANIDGLLFTGSSLAGRHFRQLFLDRPHVMLALELGGNNPLVAWEAEPEDVARITRDSAFVTTGQRCSCARRLIVPTGARGDRIVDAVVDILDSVTTAAWNDGIDAFMGPLISAAAADSARMALTALEGQGGRTLRSFGAIDPRSAAFVAPALIDVTGCVVPDAEVFAPMLQVHRVDDFSAAIALANDTRYGLSAGLIDTDDARWRQFRHEVRAGIVNRNRPTTGAASDMPFGGLGESGNHRPGAYYAADYCAYPVASFEAAFPGS
ncbi:N-succinylglutamate 5-semialdehyde dehydrogenase [Sphingomonas sp. Leaf17]|uniref:succinylglutamate-semialdehyde dehydrogenase n=1 Tax=Sphingomonas sp. Leaf17 TaxID=1735683 RepID=UPI0006FFA00E|nr:succinylglutamate-semialdehyde dehydrogenase [Sphingomonas sp. Leaf17]KQM67855.1 N-succinylglutamate 5-semialdehyde dehydrogenase [Sphingomonas sp. Leaf17]